MARKGLGRVVAKALTQLLLIARFALGALRLRLRERRTRTFGARARTAHGWSVVRGLRRPSTGLSQLDRGHVPLEHGRGRR